jgi:hypothetical protein
MAEFHPLVEPGIGLLLASSRANPIPIEMKHQENLKGHVPDGVESKTGCNLAPAARKNLART